MPQALPTVWAEFMKGGKASSSASEYGMKEKIADGLCFKVKRMNVTLIPQPNVDPITGQSRCVHSFLLPSEISDAAGKPRPSPLLILNLRDLVIQQTDEKWQVVELKNARKLNQAGDAVFIFRNVREIDRAPCTTLCLTCGADRAHGLHACHSVRRQAGPLARAVARLAH